MIKLPKGTPLHKELNSSFVDLGKLLKEMKTNKFSGLIELMGVHSEGLILIELGTVIGARIAGDQDLMEREQVNVLLQKVHEENMLISTFQMPPESVILLNSFLDSEKIHENLSSEFTDPNKLISKFSAEKGEYFIEVIFQKNLGSGLLFIQDGETVDALLSLLGKSLTKGNAAITDIIEGAGELGAMFNVYRAEIDTGKLSPPSSTVPMDEVQRIMGILMKEFHNTVEQVSLKKIDFELFLREACLSMAEEYPFLDPFAAEFVYKDQQIELFTDEDPAVIARRIMNLIQQMMDRLREEKTDFPLDDFRREVMVMLEESHKKALVSMEMRDLLNSLK